MICTVIWVASGASGFFWPILVALGVLVPLLRNGWRLYGPAPEFDEIERELEARRHKNAAPQPDPKRRAQPRRPAL